jgi:hypothetical protein
VSSPALNDGTAATGVGVGTGVGGIGVGLGVGLIVGDGEGDGVGVRSGGKVHPASRTATAIDSARRGVPTPLG